MNRLQRSDSSMVGLSSAQHYGPRGFRTIIERLCTEASLVVYRWARSLILGTLIAVFKAALVKLHENMSRQFVEVEFQNLILS